MYHKNTTRWLLTRPITSTQNSVSCLRATTNLTSKSSKQSCLFLSFKCIKSYRSALLFFLASWLLNFEVVRFIHVAEHLCRLFIFIGIQHWFVLGLHWQRQLSNNRESFNVIERKRQCSDRPGNERHDIPPGTRENLHVQGPRSRERRSRGYVFRTRAAGAWRRDVPYRPKVKTQMLEFAAGGL